MTSSYCCFVPPGKSKMSATAMAVSSPRRRPFRRGHLRAILLAGSMFFSLAPASAVAALVRGVADSDAATFSDPAWPGLGVRLVRAVAPWDVALTDPAAPTA